MVADGMGGHTGGALAAEQVLHAARQNFEAHPPRPETVREMLAAAIGDAHDGIKLTRYTSEQDPHSTACLLVLQRGRGDWAHCGDSRLYHFRDGNLLARTVDHSYVNDLLQRGLITEEQAEHHPNRNLLTSCLGDKDAPRIEFGESTRLVGGDCFLLCSDGIWGCLADSELGRVLNELPPRQAAEVLINAARSRAGGRGDNCSLAIVRLKEAAQTA